MVENQVNKIIEVPIGEKEILIELQEAYETMDKLLKKYGTSRENEGGYPSILAPTVPEKDVKKSDAVKYDMAYKNAREIIEGDEFNDLIESIMDVGTSSDSSSELVLAEHNSQRIVYQEVLMKPIRYIGVGEAGINIAKTISPKSKEVIGFVTNEKDAVKHKDCVIVTVNDGGSGRKFETGKKMFVTEPNKSRIQVALDEINKSTVFVCWSLGGGSGSAGSSVIINELLSNKNTVFGIAVTPFLSMESTRSYLINATLSLNDITALSCGEVKEIDGVDEEGNLITKKEKIPGTIGLLVADNDWLKDRAMEEGYKPIEDEGYTEPYYQMANYSLKKLFQKLFAFDKLYLNTDISTQYTLDREEYKSVVWGLEDSNRRIKQGRGLYDYGFFPIDLDKDKPKIELTLSNNPLRDITNARDIMLVVAINRSSSDEKIKKAEIYLERMEELILSEEKRGRKPKEGDTGKKQRGIIGKSYRVVKGIVGTDDDEDSVMIVTSGMPINIIRTKYHSGAKMAVRGAEDKLKPKSKNKLSDSEVSFLDS